MRDNVTAEQLRSRKTTVNSCISGIWEIETLDAIKTTQRVDPIATFKTSSYREITDVYSCTRPLCLSTRILA